MNFEKLAKESAQTATDNYRAVRRLADQQPGRINIYLSGENIKKLNLIDGEGRGERIYQIIRRYEGIVSDSISVEEIRMLEEEEGRYVNN